MKNEIRHPNFLKCSQIQRNTGEAVLCEMQNCIPVITANATSHKCFTQSEPFRGKQCMVLCNIIGSIEKAYVIRCLNQMKRLALIT